MHHLWSSACLHGTIWKCYSDCFQKETTRAGMNFLKHFCNAKCHLWEQFHTEYSSLKSNGIITRAHWASSSSEFTEEPGMLDIKQAVLEDVGSGSCCEMTGFHFNAVSHYSIKQYRISETFPLRNLYYEVPYHPLFRTHTLPLVLHSHSSWVI